MLLFIMLAVLFFVLWYSERSKCKKAANEFTTQIESLTAELTTTKERLNKLSQYESIANAEEEAKRILTVANETANQTKELAQQKLTQANEEASKITQSATNEAKSIIDAAEEKAKQISGDAYELSQKTNELKHTATAMKNIIEGYGDDYLKPTYSLLDDLAEDFAATDAGQKLKDARKHTAQLIKAKKAATCDYVEENRKSTAIAFVVDAFNGKVDSILSKTKKDNFGTLEQKIKDSFYLVNANGKAFKNAVITNEFLDARLDELKWACIVQELKAKEQEEQRRIREQMREEEKARREYERARKEAEKEEAMLRKAMEKAQAMLQDATDAKRTEYESKLSELQQKLSEAEAKGQRALSMAQQTKHGNVYVISNIGSFGENVYKVGMTRRLEPLDRVKELGDASVPFAFDVHAIIESDDAPALEHELHKALSLMQVNKVNPRKEFFRVSLHDIKALVEKKGYSANWTMAAEAAEYKETLTIEKNMKSDPEAKIRWENFANSISEEDDEQAI